MHWLKFYFMSMSCILMNFYVFFDAMHFIGWFTINKQFKGTYIRVSKLHVFLYLVIVCFIIAKSVYPCKVLYQLPLILTALLNVV